MEKVDMAGHQAKDLSNQGADRQTDTTTANHKSLQTEFLTLHLALLSSAVVEGKEQAHLNGSEAPLPTHLCTGQLLYACNENCSTAEKSRDRLKMPGS